MSEIKTENTSVTENQTITKKKVRRLPKSLGLHLAVFVLVFVVCGLYAFSQMTSSRSVTITVNSTSISKGQNPDGTPFDIYRILSDEVLEAAVAKLGSAVSAGELRAHLSVADALRAETNQQLKQSILDGEYENTYFPTVYRLTYSTLVNPGSDADLGQKIRGFFGGSAREIDQILEAVSTSYQEMYEDSYLTYSTMFDIDWKSIDEMDYYNRAEALRTEAMRIFRFLQDKHNENSMTVTPSSGLTYGDLCNDLWQLISVDIENHRAFIIQNNLTTERKMLLRQFRYMEEIYKEDKERRTEEYLILDEAVDMYDSTTTKVVFIPALDQNDSFYMNRTKVGLDYLVESADSARLAADEAEHNAQYYQYLQTCFADAVTPKKSQTKHADAVYLDIQEQVEDMAETVKLLVEENNRTANEGIKVSGAEMSAGILGVGMSFAKRFVIVYMAAYVLICIPSAFTKKKRENAGEV